VSITNDRGHLSSQTIDLLLLTALSASETNDAKHHLDQCASCKQRWVELNEDSQRFKQYVFAKTLPQVEARVAAQGEGGAAGFFERFRLKLVLPALGLAAAAAMAFTLTAGPGTQTEDDVYIGVKGGQPSLELFGQRDGTASFPVKGGAELKPKDRIRFVVTPGAAKFVLVASVDGEGTFSVYHPFGGAQSQALGRGARAELDSTIELDDALGTETLVAVFSDQPVQAEAVRAAVSANRANPQVDGATVVTRVFVKVAP